MSEINDSGWYRVNQEKEKLEKEIKGLREELDFTVKAVLEEEVVIEQLHEALSRFEHYHVRGRDRDICVCCGLDLRNEVHIRETLNPPKGPSSATKSPSDP